MMRLIAGALGFLAAIVGGCTSSDPPARGTLSARDFASRSTAPISPAVTLAPSAVPAKPTAHGPSEVTGPIAAADGIMDVSASAGEPELGAGDLPPPSVVGEFVDGVVGRVNNKAIYINDFLEGDKSQAGPGARLRALAPRMSRDQWTLEARRLIAEELNRQIEDELLLAEARATFVTPEQRANLRAFLEAVRGNILSDNYGSRHRAEQTLLREKGRDVEGELQNREQAALISSVIEGLDRRINVPFREVALSYERQYEKFNPPPRAEFRMIKIAASKTDEIAAVTEALKNGDDFASVASRPINEFSPKTGGRSVFDFRGDFATTEFWAIRALNEAAHTLSPGGTSAPVASNDYLWWVHLDRIDRTSMSLYDAQLSLELSLRQSLSNEARARLIQRLKDRASFTSIDVMVDLLVKAAAERYLGPARG